MKDNALCFFATSQVHVLLSDQQAIIRNHSDNTSAKVLTLHTEILHTLLIPDLPMLTTVELLLTYNMTCIGPFRRQVILKGSIHGRDHVEELHADIDADFPNIWRKKDLDSGGVTIEVDRGDKNRWTK